MDNQPKIILQYITETHLETAKNFRIFAFWNGLWLIDHGSWQIAPLKLWAMGQEV